MPQPENPGQGHGQSAAIPVVHQLNLPGQDANVTVMVMWPGGGGLLKVNGLIVSGMASVEINFMGETHCGQFMLVEIPIRRPLPEGDGTYEFSAPTGLISFTFTAPAPDSTLMVGEVWIFRPRN